MLSTAPIFEAVTATLKEHAVTTLVADPAR
jgi:hydroxymethylpyrimidine/phosphomethylpyrimidine kinase